MKKVILAGLAGGLVLFIWSFVAWVVLPLHTPSMRALQNESAVIDELKPAIATKGVYLFPHNPGASASKEAQAEWAQKMQRGPTGMIIYNPEGTDPMMPSQMVVGIFVDILSALVVAWILDRSTARSAPFFSRIAFCGMFGIFAIVFDYLTMWNWMGYPTDFTTAMCIDALISWVLAGLAISAIVKTPVHPLTA